MLLKSLVPFAILCLTCLYGFHVCLLCASLPLDCAGTSFPSSAFGAGNDPSKVHLRVSSISPSGFLSAGFTKYLSVFGLYIISEAAVPDAKLVHVASSLAELLDNSYSGYPTNPDLVKTLRDRGATLGLVASQDSIQPAFEALPSSYGCSLFLVLENDENILPHGNAEKDCTNGPPDETEDGNVDRTAGLLGDFIIQSGYPHLFPPGSEVGRLVERAFTDSVEQRWFKPEILSDPEYNYFCDPDCQRISFQSWALSSAMGVDACSCRLFGVFTLCNPEEMKIAHPQLYGALREDLKAPTGYYYTQAAVY